MVIKISKKKGTEEIMVLSDMCESTLKKEPTGNIMDFISDKKNVQSAKLMNWAIVTSVALIANQLMQDEWIFTDVSRADADKAVAILTRVLKDLQELI